MAKNKHDDYDGYIDPLLEALKAVGVTPFVDHILSLPQEEQSAQIQYAVEGILGDAGTITRRHARSRMAELCGGLLAEYGWHAMLRDWDAYRALPEEH